MNGIVELWTALRTQWTRAPVVAGLGFLGLALAGVCLLGALVRGVQVPPEGDLWETATFDGAVGIFLLTLALLVPLTDFGEKGRRRWTGTLAVAVLYSYGIETVQAFRGLDPRFSAVAGPFDRLLGLAFLVAALTIMVLFVVLVRDFFRGDATPLGLAVRYGSAASLLAFGVGIAMSVAGGRAVAPEGNLLFLHAAGFHGIQAVPLVALLLGWSGAPQRTARRWVHRAGLAWTGVCVSVLWQAVGGRAPLEASPATGAALLFLAWWSLTALVAVRAWTARPAPVPAP